jgi:hypothetical protein
MYSRINDRFGGVGTFGTITRYLDVAYCQVKVPTLCFVLLIMEPRVPAVTVHQP